MMPYYIKYKLAHFSRPTVESFVFGSATEMLSYKITGFVVSIKIWLVPILTFLTVSMLSKKSQYYSNMINVLNLSFNL